VFGGSNAVYRFIVAAALFAAYCFIFFYTHDPLPSEAPNTASDGIVLIAGDYPERTPKAAELFHKGTAPRIILANDGVRSGWSSKHQRNLYSIERSEEMLVQLGAPREAIRRVLHDLPVTIHLRSQASKLISCRTSGEHSGVRLDLLLFNSEYNSLVPHQLSST